MKIKNIAFILLLLYSTVEAQTNCDTGALIRSFIQIQFGPTVKYDLQDYKCLKSNNKAKETALRLLRKNWTKEDYMQYVLKIIKKDSIRTHNETMDIIKKDSARYKAVFDSIQNKRAKIFEDIFLSERVSGYLIEIVGYLYYKESIPILKKLLSDPNYSDYAYKIKLSLARLGDVISENEVIKLTEKDTISFGGMLNKLKDIYFIRSQKGIYNVAQVLKSKRKAVLISESHAQEYISYEFLSYLKSVIANKDLQDYFTEKDKHRKPYAPDIDEEDVKFAIQWFEKNKGKYIIKED